LKSKCNIFVKRKTKRIFLLLNWLVKAHVSCLGQLSQVKPPLKASGLFIWVKVNFFISQRLLYQVSSYQIQIDHHQIDFVQVKSCWPNLKRWHHCSWSHVGLFQEDQTKKEIWFLPIPIHTCKDPWVPTVVIGFRIERWSCWFEVRDEILFKEDPQGVDSRWLWKTLSCLVLKEIIWRVDLVLGGGLNLVFGPWRSNFDLIL